MNSREVYFSGIITEKSIVELRNKVESLYREESLEPIVLYIGSGGGSRTAAISFFEWVRINNISLTTIAMANVFSAAITIFLAGKLRKASTATSFMIHPGGTYLNDFMTMLGRIIPLRRFKEDRSITAHNSRVSLEIIKSRTNISEEDARRSLTKSFLFLDAKEAKRNGLIHEII